MPTLIPRLHQEKAIKATFNYLETNDGVGLVVAPVASGKSLIIAETIKRACQAYPKTNCLVLTHVAKLLIQDEKHLKGQFPEIQTSFYAQKLGKKSFHGQAIFATINSIYKKAYKIPKNIDIIFIDEGHLVSSNEETMYRAFLKDMLIINPYVRILGYTGTDFRATEGRLTEGDNRLFTDVIYQIPMLYLIEKGFLCPLTSPPVKTKMSTQGVQVRNGDYVEKQLQEAVDKDPITRACVSEIIEYGALRNKWLVFTAGIAHCEHVRDEFRTNGISCEMVTSKTPAVEELKIYEKFERGEFKCLVNVSKITTGVDVPSIDLIALMRPMRSPVLYVQCGGRGMRTYPGKSDCCLLDFGGVIDELGPIDLVDAVKANKGDGEAPIKVCPECRAICFAGVRECPDCGYQFPDNPLQLKKEASTAAVMSNQIEPEWYDVMSINYKAHVKAGKDTPTMCVTYYTLSGTMRDFVCYEHIGTARERAAKWHKLRSAEQCPRKVEEALKIKFNEPKKILARKVGKFFEIVDYAF